MRPEGRWVLLSGSASSGSTVGIAGVVRVRLVGLVAYWGSLGWFGFVWIVPVNPGCCYGRSGSSDLPGCAIGGAGFVRVRFIWAVLSVSQGSLGFVCFVGPVAGVVLSGSQGLLGFVWFVRVHAWGRWVRAGSSGSSRCVQHVAVFFRAHLVCPGVPWGSFRFVRFIQMRPGYRWVLSGLSG